MIYSVRDLWYSWFTESEISRRYLACSDQGNNYRDTAKSGTRRWHNKEVQQQDVTITVVRINGCLDILLHDEDDAIPVVTVVSRR